MKSLVLDSNALIALFDGDAMTYPRVTINFTGHAPTP